MDIRKGSDGWLSLTQPEPLLLHLKFKKKYESKLAGKCIFLPIDPRSDTGHHHTESFGAKTVHTALPAPPCGRRGCSDAVIQWAPASSGRSAASLSQRHFCARQVRSASHSAVEKRKTALRELLRCIWRRRLIFSSFYPPPTRRFCKDERWLRHLGVHLTCGRILGKMS